MTTATQEPQTEQVEVTFFSRCPEQVLTLRPERHVSDGQGGKELLTRELHIQRQEEVNRQRELRGEAPLEIDDTPWKVTFENSQFATADLRVIEKLRNHPTFKTPGPSGFDEEPPPIPDPVDALTDPMKLIARASVDHDVIQLEAIRETEAEGKNRPVVIEAVETALEMIAEESPEPGGAAETGDGDHGEPDGSDGTA